MLRRYLLPIGLLVLLGSSGAAADESQIDFNRDIRPILSNRCFTCHGPDGEQRQADLRLDLAEEATRDLGGYRAIVPGKPKESTLMERIVADDDDTRMPPADAGSPLSSDEVDKVRRWIEQGAKFSKHWSYEPPVKPDVPDVRQSQWVRNPIDAFVLKELESIGLGPAREADRYTLIRRLSLDLTGLPPTLEEVEQFVNDRDPRAYENLVERLLKSDAYAERWAAMWLDLARYADSAGYANDPPRTIWLYRDWVVRAFAENMPFDQFTIEQLAGDLLPNPTESQRIATAFHRNTLTNSEGGTNDEEFRSVAVVDRVNTTMEVWMGTTMGCAQCHNHKYDPLTQREYFQLYAFLNNTADSDRANEAPLLSVFTNSQQQQQQELERDLATLESQLTPDDAAVQRDLAAWETRLKKQPPVAWTPLQPTKLTARSGSELTIVDDQRVVLNKPKQGKDTYSLEFETPLSGITGFRLEALPHEPLPSRGPGHAGGNFVVTELRIEAGPTGQEPRQGSAVRITLPGKQRFLHLAEVEVFRNGENIARGGKATQSSTDFGGQAARGNDGNTSGEYTQNSVTHTAQETDPWWQVDFAEAGPIDRVVVWNRADGLQSRLDGFRVELLDSEGQVTWSKTFAKAPQKEQSVSLGGLSDVQLTGATASYEQPEQSADNPYGKWAAAATIDGDHKGANWGWAVSPRFGKPHSLIVECETPQGSPGGTAVRLHIDQNYGRNHLLGHFRVLATTSQGPLIQLPDVVVAALEADAEQRTAEQRQALVDYFKTTYEPPADVVAKIAAKKKQLASIKPVTVPVMEELAGNQRRKTHVQIRGNFLVTAEEVHEQVPEAFHPFPDDWPRNRLGLARWLVHPDNPLTARVVANRYWEQLFGAGIVRTSEEFGMQGEYPTHPQLLDWLATELVENRWDVQHLLRTIVTSSTYRQSSKITPEKLEADPFNRRLSRGPRFRLSAEMIRDQALAVAGLLSRNMYGPSVQPPRPNLGLKAAFGGSTDWKTSPGEDKFRRGIYTSWRRSLPYPSMATFDAPSRNICTIRRIPTNTPLQALVTMNDPVYVEAAQGLARRMMSEGGQDDASRARYGFQLCLARPPSETELSRLVALFQAAQARFTELPPENAQQLATDPIGPLPENSNAVDLAAWTVVGNVLLNLDETLAKR